MSEREDSLSRALQQLRDESNPHAMHKQRVLLALQGAPPRAAGPEPQDTPYTPGISMLRRRAPRLSRLAVCGGVALGGALFAAGFFLGRQSVGLPLETVDAPVVPAQQLAPATFAVAPAAQPEAVSVAAPPVAAPSVAVTPEPVVARSSPKPRASASARPASAPAALSLAEALQLLHRAERAIYAGNGAWALSLLDELDARAPRALLREERVATRVLALCRDGKVAEARQLASAARSESPDSIYGALLESGCNGQASSAAAPPVESLRRP